ncbi:MAG: 30S ribosomal protein S15 [Myxococcota bacterium]|jgi:small subunit ribosomal protein S15|nr:30S ribosomal protein S15 [Myxococcota bacterium]
MLTTEDRKEIVEKFGDKPNDSGNTKVQIALMTARIVDLRPHFEENKKDHHSRRGLLTIVAKRRSLLDYLKRKDIESYRSLIAELGIRR